jgi:hypothetical protein
MRTHEHTCTTNDQHAPTPNPNHTTATIIVDTRVSSAFVLSQNAYMLFYVRQTMKPLAELPAPSEAPQPAGAAAAGLAGSKRAAAIGPQLPPELLAKRRRVEGEGEEDEEEQQEEGGQQRHQIGPALPPGWSGGGGGGAAASVAASSSGGPSVFARKPAAAGAAPPSRLGAGSGAAAPPPRRGPMGYGPPIRSVNITVRPKSAPGAPAAPAAAPAAAALRAPSTVNQPHQQQQPPPLQQQQQEPSDPALAAVRRNAVGAIFDLLRSNSSVVAAFRAALLARKAAGLPLVRPSQMGPDEARELRRVVGQGAAKEGLRLLQGEYGDSPRLAAWREGVAARAAAEVAAARSSGGGCGGGRLSAGGE